MAGVNDCGLLLGTYYIISMDRLWLENRWDQVKNHWGQLIIRACVWQKYSVRVQDEPNVIVTPTPMDHRETALNLNPGSLNGNNSGFCAFNWAVQQRPEELYLFGFDMQPSGGKRHFHAPYPWSPEVTSRYTKWAAAFDAAKPITDSLGITVFNCSDRSLIQAYERVPTQGDVMERLLTQ